jgi:hypothetical protein
VIGQIYYSTSTMLASFQLQEWNNNCLLLGSSSYYSPPRVRFTTATVNNATGAISLSGQSWTSMTATAVDITLTFGPTCASRNDQSSLAAQLTPFYTRGQYTTSTAGLYSTMLIAGDMYALSTWRFADIAVASGKYTPRSRALAASTAGINSFTDYIGIYNGQVYNATYTAKNVLQLTVRFASGANPSQYSGNGYYYYMVLPLAYSGATPADIAYNGASPNGDNGSKSADTSKTGIIVGVIIAIVVVIAIVAFIVVRSSGSRPATNDQQGGQDYRPMNGV